VVIVNTSHIAWAIPMEQVEGEARGGKVA